MSEDWSIPRFIDERFIEFLLLSWNDWIDAKAFDCLKFICLLYVDTRGLDCCNY
jgi:hypothetical protein